MEKGDLEGNGKREIFPEIIEGGRQVIPGF